MNTLFTLVALTIASVEAAQPTQVNASVGLRPLSPEMDQILNVLSTDASIINSQLMISQLPNLTWVPSTLYNVHDLADATTVMYTTGAGNLAFYAGDDEQNYKLGLVNLAAFVAQSMKETIQYDACDENSWDLVGGKYPLSNSCGQLGQSYQDYKCPAGEEQYACELDPTMQIKAATNAKWYGAPEPMFCGPKTVYPETGAWDYSIECNKPWASPPVQCTAYAGQLAGGVVNVTGGYANSAGRVDVENCCWWGRGVIQTSGPCNFGKLNYFLGARAAREGRPSAYPSHDFCKDPESICADNSAPELKWIAGIFYWLGNVQNYNDAGFNYLTSLKAFVAGGYTDTSFIDAVSGIVNRGCPHATCPGTGAVDGLSDRRNNFLKALAAFGLTQ